LVLATLAGCAWLAPTPPLFPPSQNVAQLDFEDAPLNEVPPGLKPLAPGRWAVADSPQAVSGSQVLVWRGDEPSFLSVGEAPRANRIGAEVAVRVLLGPAGGGIACEDGGKGGVVLKAEPAKRRIALYRQEASGLVLLRAETAPIEKGKWVRLGLRCEPQRAIGYLDGKPVVRARVELAGGARLALYADPGVTAQFDDLRYSLR
jgi:hypothetical protein